MAKYDPPAALEGIEKIGEPERLQRIPGAHDALYQETWNSAVQGAAVVIEEIEITQDVRDETVERRACQASIEPMTDEPVRSIALGLDIGGIGRKRARIPAVDEDAVEIDHRSCIDR